ncbi:MAG: hypothetical protein II180_10725 [Proteobacteria bacterium]|nr:hypothetical protein [Pseudomonadota bacterium]
MKRLPWFVLLGLFCVLGCNDEENPERETCDYYKYVSHCSDNHKSYFWCSSSILAETKCEDGERCVDDAYVGCRSNKAEDKPEEGLCEHNPHGDGKDYMYEPFQNPDNDNYWEFKEKLIENGLCLNGRIVYEGDASSRDYDGIVGCNSNVLYYSALNLGAGKDKAYEIYKMDCGETKRCDEMAGCMVQCAEVGETTYHQSWPNSDSVISATCTNITNGTKNQYDKYYTVGNEYAIIGVDDKFYSGTQEWENTNNQACGDDFSAMCYGNVAIVCVDMYGDASQRAFDCGTSVCADGRAPFPGLNSLGTTNYNMHGAWCLPRCHESEKGKTFNSCYYVTESWYRIGSSIEASTTFECTDDYSRDGVKYTPMSVEYCEHGCDRSTGKCFEE